MKRLRSVMAGVVTVCILAISLAGCASQMALFKGGASKSFALQTTDYDNAFSQVSVAAKEIGYSVTRQDKEKGTFFLSRGYGYSEFTNMEIRLAKGEAGALKIDLVASSSQSGETVINEFMTAYGKHVPTK